MIYVRVNGTEYPAEVRGTKPDRAWNDRESKTITLTMSHEEADKLFVNGVEWQIVRREMAAQIGEDGNAVRDEEGSVVQVEEVTEWDNSNYCVAGTITDHRDGTLSVKMGTRTAEEILAELEAAYDEN